MDAPQGCSSDCVSLGNIRYKVFYQSRDTRKDKTFFLTVLLDTVAVTIVDVLCSCKAEHFSQTSQNEIEF